MPPDSDAADDDRGDVVGPDGVRHRLDAEYDEPTFGVGPGSITIRRYYFPTAGSKTIAFDQIRAVSIRPVAWATRWRLWGSSNLRNWLPLELGRSRKKQLVEFDVGKRIRPSLTPDDAERVVALIRRQLAG